MGPPWDFDAWTFGMFGNKYFSTTESALYFCYLFKDPQFKQLVKEKWNDYKSIWRNDIPKYIDEQYALIYHSALRNEKMWPEWHELNQYGIKSYRDVVLDMKQSYSEQLEWMDSQISLF